MEAEKERPFTIGISGISCAGKTTLSRSLIQELPSSVHSIIIHQDEYYKKEGEVPVEDGEENWDSPLSINIPSFFNSLASAISCPQICPSCSKETSLRGRNHLIVVEGLFLFHEKKLSDLFDCKVVLDLDFETAKKRRQERGYKTKEGGYQTDPPNYFDKFVWPSFQKYNSKEVLKSLNKELVFIDAKQSIADSVHLLLHRLQSARLISD